MSNELVLKKDQAFPLATGGEAAAVLAENLAGESLGIGDLERIKVPAGGGLTWEVPANGDLQPAKEFDAIIVHQHMCRAYWETPDPSDEPPTCSSVDAVTGHGTPGGNCAACPLAEFGSKTASDGKQGRGQACGLRRRMFLVLPNQPFPVMLSVPPGSLKSVKGYLTRLGRPYWKAVTRFTLQKEKNKGGIDYAQVVCRFVGDLPPAIADQVRVTGDQFRSAIMDIKADEFVAAE